MSGDDFKIALKKLGLTKQTEIADKLNKKPQDIQAWFKLKNVSTNTLEIICDAFGLKINDFYKDTSYANNEAKSEDKIQAAPSGFVSEQLFAQILAQKDQAIIDKIHAIEERNEALMLVEKLKHQIDMMEQGMSVTEIAKKEEV